MSDCVNSASKTKMIWNEKDPKTGLNFPVWKRNVLNLSNCTSASSCKEECEA